jgi:hypothetical protein
LIDTGTERAKGIKMAAKEEPGIYLIVHFEWPKPFKPEFGQFAKDLHDAVQGQDWIREVLTASGGIGSGQSSLWVFWLKNYGALDRLFSDQEEPASEAYRAFFNVMDDVSDSVREEVRFR